MHTSLNEKETVSCSIPVQCTYMYIHDILTIHNSDFENYLGQIYMYPVELEIKNTTESITSASYLDLLPSIARNCQLNTSIYDKRDDNNFHITHFLFLSSSIPYSATYSLFVSQLIRYALACSSKECLLLIVRWISNKLFKQEHLKSSFREFEGRYENLSNNIKAPSREC